MFFLSLLTQLGSSETAVKTLVSVAGAVRTVIVLAVNRAAFGVTIIYVSEPNRWYISHFTSPLVVRLCLTFHHTNITETFRHVAW